MDMNYLRLHLSLNAQIFKKKTIDPDYQGRGKVGAIQRRQERICLKGKGSSSNPLFLL